MVVPARRHRQYLSNNLQVVARPESAECRFFAPAETVNEEELLIRVDVVDEKGTAALVRLPAPAFEVSSQVISVPKGNVMQC